MIDIRQLGAQLEKYGFGETEAKIYLYLLRQNHELSVVEIARGLKMGRTPVYNALDRLDEKGVIEKTVASNGYNYVAAHPDKLERYWHSKTRRMQNLGEQLPTLVNVLEGMGVGSGYKSQVNYFTGRKGLEQITYNSLRANGDLYIYEVATDMTIFVDNSTAEEFRQMLVDREITIHQLTNHTEFSDYTSVEKMVTDFWDIRHVDPKTLKINFEMLIYNDVCALYSVNGRDVFGVEIHNPNLAAMQIQIFKAIQQLGKPMIKDGVRGAAHLG